MGVFGTDNQSKSVLEASVAKKSEAEGIMVHTRTEGGRRYSFLDTDDFPGRIQGYARIASIVDHALYLFPRGGRLVPPDGELAVLLGSFGLPGSLVLLDGSVAAEDAKRALKGTIVADYSTVLRRTNDSAIDLSHSAPRGDLGNQRTLVYVDRVFTVKGVGTVALGFVLSGRVSIHDQLRPIPGPSGVRADVKGIQINDVDFESAGRGIRVGLALRGVTPEALEKSHWLDDGSFATSSSPTFEASKSPFYRPDITSRELHVQLPGEMAPARLETAGSGTVTARMPWEVPLWEGMKAAAIDLNGGSLRVAAAMTGKF